jgi:hypothetical protein
MDKRDAHGAEAVASSWDGRPEGHSELLWCRPPGSEEWRSCLRDTMQDGRGRTPKAHHMRARDTSDITRERCIRGATESGDPEISNSCEVQEENPASVEDR